MPLLSRHTREYLPVILMVSLGALFLGLRYGSFAFHHYVSAPGGDLVNHVVMMRDLEAHGLAVMFSSYPRLFHLILLITIKLTGLRPLTALLYLLPLMMLAVSLATGWLASVIAGRWAGLAAFFTLLFISSQPWQTLYDGGFPNILAAGVWVPLWIVCTSYYFGQRNWKYGIGSILTSLAIVLTHHISTGYLVVLYIALLIRLMLSARPLWVLAGAALLALYLATPLSNALWILLHQVVRFQAHYPWVIAVGKLDNPNAIWLWSDYPNALGWFVLAGGLVGFITLLRLAWSRSTAGIASYLLLVWAVVLLIGSREQVLGFPLRLARDAGIPLAASVGILFAQVGRWVRYQPLQVAVGALFLLLGFSQLSAQFERVIGPYEPTIQYTLADREAVDSVTRDNLQVASISNLLATVDGNGVKQVRLIPGETESIQQANLKQLAPYQAVIMEQPLSGGEEAARTAHLLRRGGFVPEEIFSDTVKTVVVFRR